MTAGSGSNLHWNAKYPSTPYWPWSPATGRDIHANPDRFVGEDVVATEKLDGGNTLLHAGEVYARSVSVPSDAKWMAMVKKHHAWKATEPDVWLYGEDIYGVHSIEYEAVAEHETFYAFALRDGDGAFAAFAEVEAYARRREIRSSRFCSGVVSGRLRRYAGLLNMLTASRPRSGASGKASC